MDSSLGYDFVVIGGGSAGYAAARTAVAQGLKTAVVEGGGEVGGLCILRGCMPSKTLIESANRTLAAREAREFGVNLPTPTVDISAVIARKRSLIRDFADYRRGQLEEGSFDFFRGRAEFEDARRVGVILRDGGKVALESSYFLVATGSRSWHPEVPGLDEVRVLTSDDILDAESLPHSVVVLGAGPVALEMAHYLQAMGTRVTIIQRGRQFLRGVDSDVAAVVEQSFRDRGMEVFTGTQLRRIERGGEGILVHFQTDAGPLTLGAEAVFNGLGRRPNLEGLGLERAGISVTEGHLAVSGTQQTAQPGIFAAGDCCGPFEIVHIAIQQGELAARNAARLHEGDARLESMDYRLKLFVVFTEPQVATVGLSEAEAHQKNIPYLTATYAFDDHGKSLVMGARCGFVKLLAAPDSGEILGGSVVGPHAGDLIHEIVVAMHFRATAAQLAAVPHYHPTLSEIWLYPAEELAEKTSHT